MKLHLCDKNPAVVAAWHAVFSDDPDVIISEGDILALEGDAIVSPANSFGWMDGGIDDAYRARFSNIEAAVQRSIRAQHDGELPIGAALMVPTCDMRIRHLICAPTMRVPEPVPDTVNAFLAMRAALLRFDAAFRPRSKSDLDQSRTLLCPGLCTLTGRMRPMQAAVQMRFAWHVVFERSEKRLEPFEVAAMHRDMLVAR